MRKRSTKARRKVKRPSRKRSAAAKRGWATRRANARKRSAAAKRGWATRRKAARKRPPKARPLREVMADVVVETPGGAPVAPDYRPYPVPEVAPPSEPIASVEWEPAYGGGPDHATAIERLEQLGLEITRDGEHVEWLPTFDEVYDYIDALVDEYDLDAHELFEIAYGYTDTDVT